MIPKIIHLIWCGGKRPEKFDKLVKRIKDINYDYVIKEWTEDNLDFTPQNNELISLMGNMAAKSDILRFEILYKYGGIYLDYDFLQIKKFDDLLNYDFVIGSGGDGFNDIWNCIILAKKNSKICEMYLNEIKNIEPIQKHEVDKVIPLTGPYKVTYIYNKYYNLENSKFLKGPYFYPFDLDLRHAVYDINDSNIEFIESYKKNETYCIHIHTCEWQKI